MSRTLRFEKATYSFARTHLMVVIHYSEHGSLEIGNVDPKSHRELAMESYGLELS
jgi:hypothetical protein